MRIGWGDEGGQWRSTNGDVRSCRNKGTFFITRIKALALLCEFERKSVRILEAKTSNLHRFLSSGSPKWDCTVGTLMLYPCTKIRLSYLKIPSINKFIILKNTKIYRCLQTKGYQVVRCPACTVVKKKIHLICSDSDFPCSKSYGVER